MNATINFNYHKQIPTQAEEERKKFVEEENLQLNSCLHYFMLN